MRFAHFTQVFPRANEPAADRYAQLWRELEVCDEVGFDFAFASIHHFHHLRPQSTVFSVAAAAHTRRMRVGPMGYTVPLYEPVRIVEEVAVLDNVVNGRLEVGLAPGITRDEFRIFGADWDTRYERAQEGLLLLRKAFTTDLGPKDLGADSVTDSLPSFSFEGPFHRYEDVRLSVQPLQRPHPPIWLLSLRPECLQLAAREGAHAGYIWLSHSRPEARARIEEYVASWQRHGHPHQPQVQYSTYVYVDESDAEARRKAAPHILTSIREIYLSRFGAGGKALAKVLEQRGQPGAAEIRRNMDDTDYIIDHDLAFVGSAETVTRKLRSAAEEGMFNVFTGEFNFGYLDEADVMRSIRLFAAHVIPAIGDVDPLREAMGRTGVRPDGDSATRR
jgi:alkanesulfonate monooxygenase SsuD/methylene tetrahydromethanopterin reductase-like flavin-dependent oxidoreductase (luciferase family)